MPIPAPDTEHPRERRDREWSERAHAIADRDGVDLMKGYERARRERPGFYRPHLDGLWSLAAQAEEWGVATNLSKQDERDAWSAWTIGNLIIALAAMLESGRGDEQRQTHGGRPIGTIRQWVKDAVAAFEAIGIYKAAVNKTGDELAVELGEPLRYLFKRAKELRGKAPADKIAEAFMADLTTAAVSAGTHVNSEEAGKVKDGPLAEILDGRKSPREAAIDATVIVLWRNYQLSRDAVKEGAKERIKQELGDKPLERRDGGTTVTRDDGSKISIRPPWALDMLALDMRHAAIEAKMRGQLKRKR